MNKAIVFLSLTALLTSCSFFSRSGGSPDSSNPLLKNSKQRFKLTDKAGEFVVYKEVGFKKSNNTYISKRQVLPFNDDRSKILEQSIVISKVGSVGKSLRIMRPEKSQYTVWFDGKKYVSNMTLNKNTHSLDIKLKSPEKQWNGTSSVKFPDTKSIYCFFSQVIECAAMSGYFQQAFKKKRGQMNFYLIWEGYPYFQEQYLNVPNSVFSKAKLSYDGKNKNGGNRFSLSFGQQVVFFLLDDKKNFVKQFWISQGMSMVASEI